MHTAARLLILACLLLVSVFGCKSTPKPLKGGGASQGFPGEYWGMPQDVPAPAIEPAPLAQSMTQPENPLGASIQTMSEERTEVRPDGTVVRSVRKASTELGGSQDMARILREYAGSEYSKRLLLALMLGGAAWFARKEWPVAAMALAAGAVATAFFGPVATLVAVALAGGIWIAYHVLKSRIPIPLP